MKFDRNLHWREVQKRKIFDTSLTDANQVDAGFKDASSKASRDGKDLSMEKGKE